MRTLRDVIKELAESTEMQVSEHKQLTNLLNNKLSKRDTYSDIWNFYIACKGLISLLDQPVKSLKTRCKMHTNHLNKTYFQVWSHTFNPRVYNNLESISSDLTINDFETVYSVCVVFDCVIVGRLDLNHLKSELYN